MPTFIDQLGTDIKKIPPVTRFISGTALAVTLAEMGEYVNRRQLFFHKDMAFRKFQVRSSHECELGYRKLKLTTALCSFGDCIHHSFLEELDMDTGCLLGLLFSWIS